MERRAEAGERRVEGEELKKVLGSVKEVRQRTSLVCDWKVGVDAENL